MVEIILGLIAAVVIVFLGVVAMQPAEFRVTRSGAIPAPGSSILFTYTANPGGECPSGNPCPCNFNGDANLNSQDFFDFLSCFFTNGCPEADYNNDMVVNSQDFFDFLGCFFDPPKGCN